jgi:hypothetical protein
MCRSTCFGRLHAHKQELTTALMASGFTLKSRCSSVVGPRPTTLLPPVSAPSPLLELQVGIPLRDGIFVSCECFVLSGRGFYGWPIPRPEESYLESVCC